MGRDPERFDLSTPGYRVEAAPPCPCEECRPGPGISYALKELDRILALQAAGRRHRMDRKTV